MSVCVRICLVNLVFVVILWFGYIFFDKFENDSEKNIEKCLKARSNRSNMLVKHYPTLLGGVGRCLISV